MNAVSGFASLLAWRNAQLDFVSPNFASYTRAVTQSIAQGRRFFILHRGGASALREAVSSFLTTSLGADALVNNDDSHAGAVHVSFETDSEACSSLLMRYIDRPAVVIAPETDCHMTRRGIYVVTIPKSGSHMLYELMSETGFAHDEHGYLNELEPPMPGTWKSVAHAHTHLVAPRLLANLTEHYRGGANHPFFSSPVVFLYRKPRDIVVSENHYYIDQSKVAQLAGYFCSMLPHERLSSLIEGDPLVGGLSERMRGYLPWFRFSNVIPVSYEELVGERGGGAALEQMQAIWALQLKLHIPGTPSVFAGNLALSAGKTATFRQGAIGDHKKQFSDIHWSLLSTVEDEYMQQMGYSTDRECADPFPAHRHVFRRRPLKFGSATNETDATPAGNHTIAKILYADYHGFNLIVSEGNIWALDMSVGDVDFGDAKKLDDLVGNRRLFKADSVDAARMAVLSHCLSRILVEPEPDGQPRLLEDDYRGYNLISYAGRAWAAEMAAGAIDLTDAEMRAAWLADGRLLRATTADGARAAVDRLLGQRALESHLTSMTSRLENEIKSTAKHADERLSEMTVRLVQGQQLLEQKIEGRLAALECPWWQRMLGLSKKKNSGEM